MSHYYSNENLNPRLPPSLLSKEDWRTAQRFGSGGSLCGGIGELMEDCGSSVSLFSMQSGVSKPGEEDFVEHGGVDEWLGRGVDGLNGFTEVSLGSRRKSFTDALQEDFNLFTDVPDHNSQTANRNGFDNASSLIQLSECQMTQLCNQIETVNTIHSGQTTPGLVRVQSVGSALSQSSASTVNPAVARSCRTLGSQFIGRSSSSCLPPIGSMYDAGTQILPNAIGVVSSPITDYGGIAAALSGLNLSKNITVRENLMQSQLQTKSDSFSASSIPRLSSNEVFKNGDILKDDVSSLASNEQISFQKKLFSNNLSKKVAATGKSKSFVGSSAFYQVDAENVDFTEGDPNACFIKHGLPSILKYQLDAGASLGGVSEHVSRSGCHAGSGFQVPVKDLFHAQHLKGASSPTPILGKLDDPSIRRRFHDAFLHDDLPEYQKAYHERLLTQQNMRYGRSLNKGGSLNNSFYGAASFGVGMPYPSIPVSGALLSSMGPGNPFRQNDQLWRLPSMLRSAVRGSKGSWSYENGVMEEGYASTLLEEFKNNKSRSFELSDLVDHIVVFSADQYGSRFIQQKLETASVEEKNKIFPEILPHARALITDVFGNYVIQKFLEHGTESQRQQLVSQLIGHVLPFSLQMYGCRVIQKALEVVDLKHQTQMASELDGSVMKCVQDQNGNHVIQKCIECVPQEKIMFIISTFCGQVVTLSTHPYGCRVIQRVLEHCDDAKTQTVLMDEIVHYVCTLAQDQYGNYVIQHVLQHGKPNERSAIISKLSGKIVKMSQQKFASNVVEKCLTYCTPEERLLLINEMLGSTEDNLPLQAMMKDQFANYVVQKTPETCDDHSREFILSRIKVHLNALKKYTYGKHIVARVEKLIASGERRMGMASSS